MFFKINPHTFNNFRSRHLKIKKKLNKIKKKLNNNILDVLQQQQLIDHLYLILYYNKFVVVQF
jgi:hypothetical protein